MIQVQPYTPRLPMQSGGGFQGVIPATQGRREVEEREERNKLYIAQVIGELLGNIYGPMKRQRQLQQQEELTSPILSRKGDQTENIRAALETLKTQQKPTGISGALDFVNPLAPARGFSSLQQGLTKQLIQSPKGRIVVGDGTTWLVNPQTGEKRDLGIPAPKGKASAELMNAWLVLSGHEERTPEQETIMKALGQKIMNQYGVNPPQDTTISPPEKPEPKKSWGWPTLTKPAYRVRPEQPTNESPISQALTAVTEKKGGGAVKMQAPDGKTYLVPADKAGEAEKRGWKRL